MPNDELKRVAETFDKRLRKWEEEYDRLRRAALQLPEDKQVDAVRRLRDLERQERVLQTQLGKSRVGGQPADDAEQELEAMWTQLRVQTSELREQLV